MDAAPMDATVPDAMAMDALPMDAMVPDAMPTDAMAFDATTPDAGFGDAVAPDDATAADATRADATTAAADANTADAGAAVDDAASNPDVDEDGYPDELGIRGGGISCQSTGSAPSLWFLLLIVAWGAWQRRRATLLAAALLAPVTASAATESAPLDRVRSRSSDARLTFVDAARPFGQGRYSLLFATSYTKNPVVFVDQSQANAALVPAVADRLGATLGGAVGVFDSLTVSADLAIVLFQSRASSLNVGASKVDLPTLDSTAIGDLTLGATWVPFDRDKLGFNLGIFGDVALPTGGGESYRGEAGIAFEPGLALGVEFGAIGLALNASYRLRRRADNLGLVIDDELRGALGGHVRFTEMFGLAVGTFASYTPKSSLGSIEATLGPTLRFGAITVSATAGTGVGSAPGTPDVRVTLALGYAPK